MERGMDVAAVNDASAALLDYITTTTASNESIGNVDSVPCCKVWVSLLDKALKRPIILVLLWV